MLTVVKDEPSERAMSLDCTAKVKDRTKVSYFYLCSHIILFSIVLQIVFGTGDTLKAVTLTANEAFVRAAAHQVSTTCWPFLPF